VKAKEDAEVTFILTVLLALLGSPTTTSPDVQAKAKAAACCCDCPPTPLCPELPSCASEK